MLKSEIAQRLGQTVKMVTWVLDENGEKAAAARRVRKSRALVKGRLSFEAALPSRPKPPSRPSALARSEAIRAAAREFAAGRIDRAELMRRIP
jgi:hypothetical protein